MKKMVCPLLLTLLLALTFVLGACGEKAPQMESAAMPSDVNVAAGSSAPVASGAFGENSSTAPAQGDELGVPLDVLAPLEAPAKAAIEEQLLVRVPDEAQITYSNFDERDASLIFTWSTAEESEDPSFYSVSFENADLEKGTGELVFVRTMGQAARQQVEALAALAQAAFADMLRRPVPEESRLVADISAYKGVRSALFSWEERSRGGAEREAALYYAGYEQVNADYTEGTLVLLDAGEAEGDLPGAGAYTDEELAEKRQVAEEFVSAQQLGATEFTGHSDEMPEIKGVTLFDFIRADAYAPYTYLVVYVDAENVVTGFALGRGDIEQTVQT